MNLLKRPIEFRNGYKDKERLRKLHMIPCVVCFTKKVKQTTKSIAHHKIGMGLGKKASDLLTMCLCESCHTKGPNAIHHIGVPRWEEWAGFTQDECIELTNKMLEHVEEE